MTYSGVEYSTYYYWYIWYMFLVSFYTYRNAVGVRFQPLVCYFRPYFDIFSEEGVGNFSNIHVNSTGELFPTYVPEKIVEMCDDTEWVHRGGTHSRYGVHNTPWHKVDSCDDSLGYTLEQTWLHPFNCDSSHVGEDRWPIHIYNCVISLRIITWRIYCSWVC